MLTTSITDIAPDILIYIARHLQDRAVPHTTILAKVMRVSKLFYAIASSDRLWINIASTYKIAIQDKIPVKSQVKAVALQMKKIVTIINPSESSLEPFPYEATWDKLSNCSLKSENIVPECLVRLRVGIQRGDCSYDELVHVVWVQLLRQFEMGKVAEDSLKFIIRKVYLSKNTYLLDQCVNLAATSSACLSIVQCFNELYKFNPLLYFDNPVIEETLSTLFESVHDTMKLHTLKKYIELKYSPSFIVTDTITKEQQSVLYMQFAKKIMAKAGLYPDPETIFSELSLSSPPPSMAFRKLYEIYADEYKRLVSCPGERQISKVISSLGSLTLK